MKQSKTFLALAIVVAVLALGIAYAAITSVTLNVNGNVTATPDQGNFKIAFDNVNNKPTFSGTGAATLTIVDGTHATMEVTGLTKVGDAMTATFTINNTSDDISADLVATPSNDNTEYFTVTATLGATTIGPKTGTTTVTVQVECIKTPIVEQKATIGVAIVATPNN